MSNTKINIPENHIDKFKFYINLPNEIRNQFIDNLNNAPLGLSPSALIDYISDKPINLSHEKIFDLLQIYLNLSGAKQRLDLSDSEFLIVLKNALSNTNDQDLNPNEEVLSLFEKLLSKNNVSITNKILEYYSGNSKNYLYSKIIQNIRPVFGDDNELLGSTIVNDLKIVFNQNDEEKEIFISIDNKDIEGLIKELKKTLESTKKIKENFSDLKIVDIK